MRGLLLLLVSSSASAQLLLQEPFEVSPDDAGWTAVAQPVGGSASIGVGRVGQGWLVTRTDLGVGVTNRSPCFRRGFDGGTGLVTVRYWMKANSTNGEFGMFPVIIQSPVNTLAEVRFTTAFLGAITPTMQCTEANGIFRACPPPSPLLLSAQDWHLIEVELEGAGSNQGRCRAAIDGQSFCEQAVDWTGLQPTSAFIGLCAVDQVWAGDMTIDELRISSQLQGSLLKISSPLDAGVQGDCVPFTVQTISSSGNLPAGPAIRTPISQVVVDGGIGFYSSSSCTTAATPPVLSANTSAWNFFVRVGTGPAVEVSAFAFDLAPIVARFTLPLIRPTAPDAGLDSGVPDSGVPDSGVSDSGVPDSGVPDSGVPDSGVSDSGVPDSGVPDSGVPDSGVPDSGVPDSGVPDSGVPDSGVPDSGVPETDGGPRLGAGDVPTARTLEVGCGCTEAPLLQLIAAIALLFRRSRR